MKSMGVEGVLSMEGWGKFEILKFATEKNQYIYYLQFVTANNSKKNLELRFPN